MKNYKKVIDGLNLTGVSLHSVEGKDDYDILTLYGGLNGKGDFLNYMRQVITIIHNLESQGLSKVKDIWLIDWINDCPDDVWTLRIGIRNENPLNPYTLYEQNVNEMSIDELKEQILNYMKERNF